MTRSCLTVTLLAALSVLTGCSEQKAPAPSPDPASAPAAAKPAADPDASLTKDERLALAKPTTDKGVDKAIADAQTAVRNNKNKDENWVILGRTWVRKARESADPGFYLNADACANVVLARVPDSRIALDLRGLVLLNGHKFDEARSLALQITAKSPEDPMAWGTLSDAYLEMGRYDDATTATQTMVDLKPNLPSYSRASHLQWLRGDVASAKETVRLALDSGRAGKSDPEPGAWVLVQAAMIFWHEGDYEGADAGCDKALDRISDYAPANVCKGKVAAAKGDYRRAAELFDRAFKVSPLAETAWLMGDAKSAMGDAAGSEAAYAIVEREGRRTDPRTLSMFYSAKNKNLDEALKLAREEYEVRKDITTEDAIAWALYRSGKVAEAKASIAKARRLGTPDARLMYHEGAIRIAAASSPTEATSAKSATELAAGRKLVEDALKKNPGFDIEAAREAKALLSAQTVASR